MKGKHYYLNQEDRHHPMEQSEALAIPFYLIYDRKGILQHKSVGFMGTKNMKK